MIPAAASTTLAWPDPQVAAPLSALRAAAPLVHCHTASVAAGFMANVLLALGASPAMIAAREEVVQVAALAGGVLLNLASVTEERAAVLLASAAALQVAGTPWVLDPVGFGALRFRSVLARDLLRYRPTVIKANASEVMSLAGGDGRAKGVDSTMQSDDALASAQLLARQTGAVVAVTGVIDYVTDGARTIAIPGGHPVMARVTGTGCALGGVVAAFLAVENDALHAAAAACAVFGAAGASAARTAPWPGSFMPGFVDALARLGVVPD